MPGTLSRFRIEALHGKRTIDIPITDNKLILIGDNGTGKSTVANFIYFFLTAQWRRMLEYEFESVLAIVDDQEITLTRKDLVRRDEVLKDKRRDYSYVKNRHETLREEFRALFEMDLKGNQTEIREGWLSEEEPFSPESLQNAVRTLRSTTIDKVLYLPTYRRIEQDLASIFPGWTQSSGFTTALESLRRKSRNPKYVELVQFGMQDVEESIRDKMNALKDNLRDDLNKLTGTYLRDVIQGTYKSTKTTEIGALDEETINVVLSRIDQSILPQPAQEQLREKVAQIRSDSHVQDEDKMIVHYLVGLIELHKKQQNKEKDVQKFVNVCNRYLTGKELIYDSMNFEIPIKQLDSGNFTRKEEDKGLLKMSMLSSGEKQIVSLFSQVYLAGSSSYFVIIDEPELSLSLPWQKHFLPDILHSGRCNGLIAVTHSPFISENDLDQYMHSIAEFMENVS